MEEYLRLEIGVLQHEVSCVLVLDPQHRIIALKQLFRGTVSPTSVYPREVVKVKENDSWSTHREPLAALGWQTVHPQPTSVTLNSLP